MAFLKDIVMLVLVFVIGSLIVVFLLGGGLHRLNLNVQSSAQNTINSITPDKVVKVSYNKYGSYPCSASQNTPMGDIRKGTCLDACRFNQKEYSHYSCEGENKELVCYCKVAN